MHLPNDPATRTTRQPVELVEMLYAYQAPFVVDSSKIADKLGLHATPLGHAISETLAS